MAIVGALPNTVKNGDAVDATTVMALFAYIQSQVNNNVCPITSGTSILKGNGAGGTTAAAAGTDFLAPAPGMVFDFAGSAVPSGYLACDGSAVSRATYSALFAAIGTTWGVGDGSTTFNLPDARGRTAIGVGAGAGLTSRALGTQNIGEEAHQLTTSELPLHNHVVNISDPGHNHGVTNGAHSHTIAGGAVTIRALNAGSSGGANFAAASAASTVDFSATDAAASAVSLAAAFTGITATTNNAGAGGSHNNMQPSIVFNKIIKV